MFKLVLNVYDHLVISLNTSRNPFITVILSLCISSCFFMFSSCLLSCKAMCSLRTSSTSETFDLFLLAAVGAGGADNDLLPSLNSLSLSLSLLSSFSSTALEFSNYCQFLSYGQKLSLYLLPKFSTCLHTARYCNCICAFASFQQSFAKAFSFSLFSVPIIYIDQ